MEVEMTRKTQACFPWIHHLILLILLILVVNLLTGAQGQNETAHVEAHFDHSSKNADVEPGNPTNGIVINTGYVIVTNQTEPEIHVNLNVSAGGWGAAMTPSSSTSADGYYWHNMGEKHPFQVTVRAPPGTSHKISQKIVVGGTWHGNVTSGKVEPTICIIFIEQYFKLLSEYELMVTVKAGERFSIPITFWNMGNDEDDVILEIKNSVQLERRDWDLDTIPKQTVAEKGSIVIHIEGTAPSMDDVAELEIRTVGCRLHGPSSLPPMMTIMVKARREIRPVYDWILLVLMLGPVLVVVWDRSYGKR